MLNEQKLKQVLEGIPKELHDIFVPSRTSSDTAKLVEAYAALKRRELRRNKVMQMQREHGLPLEPNSSMARVEMKIRLKRKITES